MQVHSKKCSGGWLIPRKGANVSRGLEGGWLIFRGGTSACIGAVPQLKATQPATAKFCAIGLSEGDSVGRRQAVQANI